MKLTLQLSLATFVALWFSTILMGQTTPDSSLIPISSARATSEDGSNLASKSFDGKSYTQWQSIPDFPNNFFVRPDRNLLYNISANQLSASSGNGNINKTVDGNLKSGFYVRSGNWFTVDLTASTPIHMIALKASVRSAIDIIGIDANGIPHNLGQYTRNDHYSVKQLVVNQTISQIKLQCSNPFLLFEIAASEDAPVEDLFFDFGKSYTLKSAELEFRGCTTADSVEISLSDDGQSWNTILKPDLRNTLPEPIKTPQTVDTYVFGFI